ncbi:hypothetical protein BGZ58_010179 [Dissophora ornata]|nr:hypothetical protein BGZ58_010179 [Dissophora ornata]
MTRALDLLEIKQAVGCFLSTKDLFSCCAVSSDWYAAFYPFLFHTVSLGPITPTPSGESIDRNRYQIRHLDLESELPLELLAVLAEKPCPRLISLCYRQVCFVRPDKYSPALPQLQHAILNSGSQNQERLQDQDEEKDLATTANNQRVMESWLKWSQIPKLIRINHTSLRSLDFWRFYHLSEPIWNSVGTCSRLEHLTLESVKILQDTFVPFWSACLKIKTVYLTNVQLPYWRHILSEAQALRQGWDLQQQQNDSEQRGEGQKKAGGNDKDQEEQDAWERFSGIRVESRLEELSVNNIRNMDPTHQVKIFKFCPGFKSLTWNDSNISHTAKADFCEAAGKEGLWRKLESVNMSAKGLGDASIASLLTSMKQPNRICLNESQFGINAFSALRGHSQFDGLRELELELCEEFSGRMTCVILESCPVLEKFVAGRVHYKDLFARIDVKLEDGGDRLQRWVCSRLKLLQIEFDLEDRDDTSSALLIPQLEPSSANDIPTEPSPSVLLDRSRTILEQLAQLSGLEVLYVRSHKSSDKCPPPKHGLKFQLAAGLENLSALTHLMELAFRNEQDMAMDDVQWMITNMSSLRSICGRLHPTIETSEELGCVFRSQGWAAWC